MKNLERRERESKKSLTARIGGVSLAGAESGGGVVSTHEGYTGCLGAEREEEQLTEAVDLH